MLTKLSMLCSREDNGAYFALCPEIKDCYTQGDTYEEAVKNLQELVKITIDTMDEDEKELILRFQNKIFSEFEVVI